MSRTKVPKNKIFWKTYVTEYRTNKKLEDYVVHFDVKDAIVNFQENMPSVIYSEKDIKSIKLIEYSYTLVDKMIGYRHTKRYILEFETGYEAPRPIVMSEKERKVLDGDRSWMYTKN